MRKDDPRLATRVTVRAPRILVGELLERLSRQAGVPLVADDWTGAGDDAVMVSLRDVPLADAMDALWSLLSYRDAEWDWRRGSKAGAFTYKLARADGARSLTAHLREQVQRDVEAQAQELIAALDMPPDQLKEAARNDFLLNSLLVDGRVAPSMRAFTSLPPEMQMSIVRGGQGLSLPVSQLSPTCQEAVHELWAWQVAQQAKFPPPPGIYIPPVPEPKRISIGMDRFSEDIAPGFSVDVGYGCGASFGGGFLNKAWRKKMVDLWTLPGDRDTDPAMGRPVVAPKSDALPISAEHPMASRLCRLSQAASLPIIARLPDGRDGRGQSTSADDALPYGKPVQTFLSRMTGDFKFYAKWRDGVLLLTYPGWVQDDTEDARVPWPLVRRLRDAEAGGDGFLSLTDLGNAAHLLNKKQLHRLATWLPVMDNVAVWDDFLDAYYRSPEFPSQVKSPQGSTQIGLAPAPMGVGALAQATPESLRLHLVEHDSTDRTAPAHEMMVSVTTVKGKSFAGQGFGYFADEYRASTRDNGPPDVQPVTGNVQPVTGAR